jgi:hypothetical protein
MNSLSIKRRIPPTPRQLEFDEFLLAFIEIIKKSIFEFIFHEWDGMFPLFQWGDDL